MPVVCLSGGSDPDRPAHPDRRIADPRGPSGAAIVRRGPGHVLVQPRQQREPRVFGEACIAGPVRRAAAAGVGLLMRRGWPQGAMGGVHGQSGAKAPVRSLMSPEIKLQSSAGTLAVRLAKGSLSSPPRNRALCPARFMLNSSDQPDPLVQPEDAGHSAATLRLISRLLIGILLILCGAALFSAAAFFMPVVLALLLALTLSPLVRFLHRRGMGEAIAAGLVVLMLTLGIASTFAALGTPFINLVDDAPRMARQVQQKFNQFSKPLSTITDAAKQVDDATGGGSGVQQVAVQQPGILSQVAGSAMSVVTTTVIVIILTLFLLASGNHFSEQIIKSFETFGDKKRALRTVRDIESEISRYLLTITVINAALGIAVGIAMWALGMPTPILWGVLAAILNFLPYIGSLGGIVIVGVVSLATFPTVGVALLPPLAYFACTMVEGQFVTPTVVGRRLRINTVAVFLAVAFWSFLWSIPGALMAVPILVFFKVLCDNVSGLKGIGRFLSAESDTESEQPT